MSYLTDAQLNFNRGIDASIEHINKKLQYGGRISGKVEKDSVYGKYVLLKAVIDELKGLKY